MASWIIGYQQEAQAAYAIRVPAEDTNLVRHLLCSKKKLFSVARKDDLRNTWSSSPSRSKEALSNPPHLIVADFPYITLISENLTYHGRDPDALRHTPQFNSEPAELRQCAHQIVVKLDEPQVIVIQKRQQTPAIQHYMLYR